MNAVRLNRKRNIGKTKLKQKLINLTGGDRCMVADEQPKNTSLIVKGM